MGAKIFMNKFGSKWRVDVAIGVKEAGNAEQQSDINQKALKSFQNAPNMLTKGKVDSTPVL